MESTSSAMTTNLICFFSTYTYITHTHHTHTLVYMPGRGSRTFHPVGLKIFATFLNTNLQRFRQMPAYTMEGDTQWPVRSLISMFLLS